MRDPQPRFGRGMSATIVLLAMNVGWTSEPNYVKVKAGDWDGTKVNSWTITPVTEKFKHMKGETANLPVPEYYLYPEGTIPRWLFSNAIRACFHGIYNLPYELRISRLP